MSPREIELPYPEMISYSSLVACSKGAPSIILERYNEPFPLLSSVALVTALQPSSLQPEDPDLGSLLLALQHFPRNFGSGSFSHSCPQPHLQSVWRVLSPPADCCLCCKERTRRQPTPLWAPDASGPKYFSPLYPSTVPSNHSLSQCLGTYWCLCLFLLKGQWIL